MSDNEDLLADELEEQSLADYNLGNEEEEQLLADDYEIDSSHNVPTSISSSFQETNDIVPTEYSNHAQYRNEPPQLYQNAESECVVPNIIVEVANVPQVQPTYAPYNEATRDSHAIVPAAVPAAPLEPPQIVPSDLNPIISNGDTNSSQEQFVTSRQRIPQIRDIPDSLDKVFVGRGGGFVRGRTSWRNPRYSHPYRRNNRGNFNQRASYPPQQIRPKLPQNRPDIRPEITPETRIEITLQNPPELPPQIRPELVPQIRPELAPQIRPELAPQIRPELAPHIHPEIVPPGLEVTHAFEPEIPGLGPEPRPQPQINPELPPEPIIHREVRFRPPRENRFPPNFQRFPNPRFMGPLEEAAPNFGPNIRPAFEPPMFQRPFVPRPSMYPVREVTPNSISHLPQVTIRQSIPGLPVDNIQNVGIVREQEVRMLPLHLPPNIPPGGLQGKKVLINPHFKGNFQRPDGVPTYIPTRIQKSPPLPPALESKFGPIKDIDDAAERFIAEQRSALASRAARNRRSPQRYIENTTIEIANDLAAGRDRELLRRQEEFINANRAGLRRRMRSPSPPTAPRRSPTPPRRRPEPVRHAPNDVDGEYRRKVREQETLRERVLRAKEVRRRKNAVLLSNQLANREREREEKNSNATTDEPAKPLDKEGDSKPVAVEQDKKQASPPATAAAAPTTPPAPPAPPVERDRSPIKTVTEQKNVTENLTPPRPPRPAVPRQPSPERALTPPLPIPQTSYDDDDLDLILDDIEDILSDEDETGRFKDTSKRRPESPRAKPHGDLRSKLASKAPKQKIVFTQTDTDIDSSTNRNVVSSSTKNDAVDKKTVTKKTEAEKTILTRQKIVFENKDNEKQKDNATEEKKTQPFSNRRVVIRRKDKASARLERDASKPNPGIFSRAVRLVLRDEHQDQPRVETVDDGDEARETGDGGREGDTASVTNLPPGITHTRLRTLAGDEVQSLILDKEERSAKITFKTSNAALTFKRKFNNKMVAASRLTVSLT